MTDQAETQESCELHRAVRNNNVNLLQDYLKVHGISDIDSLDTEGCTPLYIAVDDNVVECCHILLEQGANPNIRCGPEVKYQTALHVAAANNNSSLVSLLLEFGARWDIKNSDQVSPLEVALVSHSIDVVHIIDTYIKHRECELRTSLEKRDIDRAKTLIGQLSVEYVSKVLSKGSTEHHSFLFKACEDGDVNMVNFLLDNGCDIGIHPVTGQSPLHAACASGKLDCAKLVLQNFPELIRAPTIDGILPLHTTCIVGHVNILRLILHHEYPEAVMKIFKEQSGDRMYRLGFAINGRDGHGRTPLHVACMMSHPVIVEELLKFRAVVSSTYREGAIHRPTLRSHNGASPCHQRKTRGCESIQELEQVMSEGLNQIINMEKISPDGSVNKPLATNDNNDGIGPITDDVTSSDNKQQSENTSDSETVDTERKDLKSYDLYREFFHPVSAEIDSIDLDGNTPLHIVVKSEPDQNIYRITELLLTNGANPDKPMFTPCGNISLLEHASLRGDNHMVRTLLSHGATDSDMKAFTTALKNQDEAVIGAFLMGRNHVDTGNKVNLVDLVRLFKGDSLPSWQSQTVTLRYVWPNVPVALNWHGLGLEAVSPEWLMTASIQHNKKKPRATLPSNPELPLYAITRIDISSNKLSHIPPELCQLPSLRSLNAQGNVIKWLPGCDINLTRSCSCLQQAISESECTHQTVQQATIDEQDALWNSPLLEELDLNHNKLTSLPRALFRKDACPSLRKLNVSHNDLEKVSQDVWLSPSLCELDLSHNSISELAFGGATRTSYVTSTSSEQSDILVYTRMPTPHTDKRISTCSSTDQSVFTNSSSSNSNTRNSVVSRPTSGAISRPTSGAHRESFVVEAQKDFVRLNNPPNIQHCQTIPITKISHWSGKLKIRVEETDNGGRSHLGGRVFPMVELNLSHNKLSVVPEGLSCVVPGLGKLNLSHNKIHSVAYIGVLPLGLTDLDISHNKLDSWISHQLLLDIADSASLDSGYSSQQCYSQTRNVKVKRGQKSSIGTIGNQCIHRSHNQLDKLKVLRLNHNGIVRFNVRPSVRDAMTTADKLEQSAEFSSSSGSYTSSTATAGSRHTSLPDLDPGMTSVYCPALSILDLRHNNLSTVDKDIVTLSQLTELKLASNDKLTELPPEMGLFRKLWNLDIKDCPVQRTLHALLGDNIRRSTAVILRYLKSVKENAVLYNRMKLMFVGIQGIGKTSLLEQLRREGAGTSKKYKNWSQRMGQSTIQARGLRGENISTVGIDIGDLTLQRGNRKVVFSTWDFGGQREYYATHQYFLSKRSLYLVLWKLTDGEQGANQILQWLVNIQARAPNSPVIIVGTHLDKIDKKYPQNYLPDLRKLVFEKYMDHTEPEKSGLPRVMKCMFVSTIKQWLKNNYISDLVDVIIRCSVEEQLPGSKGVRLLEQKVPASYMQLDQVVRELAEERKISGKDPVLHAEQYKMLAMHRIEAHGWDSFHDLSELQQATQFLHENGVLLHYDDVNLQDVYFLDPQWLCDVLANVVTIREINSLAKSGIMRTDDLKLLFKNAAFRPDDIKAYIINLLNKFEVALMWDKQNLLIPSMLPTLNQLKCIPPEARPKIPVLGSSEALSVNVNVIHSDLRPRKDVSTSHMGQSHFHTGVTGDEVADLDLVQEVKNVANPATAIIRLYLMSYFPSGFWPRLITRLLGDPSFYATVLSLYNLPDSVVCDETFMRTQGTCPAWECWQTGLKLKYLGSTLLKVSEQGKDSPSFCDYRKCELLTHVGNDWSAVDNDSTAILEILIPNQVLNMTLHSTTDEEGHNNSSVIHETVTLRPSPQVVAVVLTKTVEHIDTLLEDWYPDLGSRFVQNSRGMYLITRLVPCMRSVM